MAETPLTLQKNTDEGLGRRLRGILLSQEAILFVIMIVAIAILATRSDRFLTRDNILTQGRLMAEIALVALPMTFIIITGGIDLSVGAIFGLCAIMLGWTWENVCLSPLAIKSRGMECAVNMPLEVSIVLALLIGVLAGLLNGWFIVRIKVPPLIMTLATLALYRGMAEGISQSRSVRGYPDWFYQLGQGNLLGLPTQIWLVIIFSIISAIWLSRTTFGRSLYAIGNNETGARFSGIAVGRQKLIIYAFSGLMAGIAAWIFVSRVSTTRSDMGSGLELDVIAAVVLGGTSIFGGAGSILGTIIGVVTIQMLKNGLSLAGVTGDATIIVVGIVLIMAVLINGYIQRRSGGSR
jgi:rhamnose transport system permease protein